MAFFAPLHQAHGTLQHEITGPQWLPRYVHLVLKTLVCQRFWVSATLGPAQFVILPPPHSNYFRLFLIYQSLKQSSVPTGLVEFATDQHPKYRIDTAAGGACLPKHLQRAKKNGPAVKHTSTTWTVGPSGGCRDCILLERLRELHFTSTCATSTEARLKPTAWTSRRVRAESSQRHLLKQASKIRG